MQITASTVALSSKHEAVSQHRQHEQLEMWRDGAGRSDIERSRNNPDAAHNTGLSRAREVANPEGLRGIAEAIASQADALESDVDLSLGGLALQPQPVTVSGDDIGQLDANQELELLVLKLLVEYMTQREIEIFKPQDIVDANAINSSDFANFDSHGTAEQPSRSGWGLRYDYYEERYEAEATQFAAVAVVHTADGSAIRVNLELNMSREFSSRSELQIRAGDAQLKDPLVINFNGQAAELTRDKITFDIDVDGRDEQISFVTPGSGFLALDKNANGRIDDGSELFGALSGNGFAELAQHDEDGNQWIDAGDSIYDRLRVWTRDTDGTQQLVALGASDIGAIYLGHINTPFKLADQNNEQLGQIRSSGMYLGEDGTAGTVQQVDLVA